MQAARQWRRPVSERQVREAAQSRDLLAEGNTFFSNGNPSSAHEHNADSEGVGTISQYNLLGP
ncbi:hypothetical protein [Deinococcus hopiensis]|uniref:hypothetical protein n=1 Tax=Deinococcus hopiensis TaxID=309885 RepID=UPI000A038801|nr:hypothetical protein [Deinococcus hopiensis]